MADTRDLADVLLLVFGDFSGRRILRLIEHLKSCTKQGSALLRWAAVEAVAGYRGGAPIRDTYQRIAKRKGNKVARVAAARKLLTLVYCGMRDGEIRCLKEAA